MTLPAYADLRQIALRALTLEDGSADAPAAAAAARRAYDDLAVVLVPLIGQVGVDALTARASHLVQREYPSDKAGDTEQSGEPFTQISFWLERQDPSLATDAAAALLSTLGGLLVTFIGEPLTMRLVRQAWPDAFPES
jgi:hypothetical protein